MKFAEIQAVRIPDGSVRKVNDDMNTDPLWIAYCENLLPKATDTDRATIYNGIGYMSAKRLSSSSMNEVVDVTSYTTMCTSGFIPAKPGDRLRLKYFAFNTNNSYIIAYDENNEATGYARIYQSNYDMLDGFSDALYECSVVLDSATFGENFNAVRVSGVFDEYTVVTINEPVVGETEPPKVPYTNIIKTAKTKLDGTEIFNGVGWTDGYRWSSSGGALTASKAQGRVTGWIPVTTNAVYRAKNFGSQLASYVQGIYVVWYHKDGTIQCIYSGENENGNYPVDAENDTVTFSTQSTDITHFRVSGCFSDNHQTTTITDNPIITMNEEIV